MICCWPEEFLDRVTTRYVSIWFDSWCMIMNPVSGSSLMYKIFCFPSTSAKEAFYYARFDKHFKFVLSGQYNNEHFTNNENLKIILKGSEKSRSPLVDIRMTSNSTACSDEGSELRGWNIRLVVRHSSVFLKQIPNMKLHLHLHYI